MNPSSWKKCTVSCGFSRKKCTSSRKIYSNFGFWNSLLKKNQKMENLGLASDFFSLLAIHANFFQASANLACNTDRFSKVRMELRMLWKMNFSCWWLRLRHLPTNLIRKRLNGQYCWVYHMPIMKRRATLANHVTFKRPSTLIVAWDLPVEISGSDQGTTTTARSMVEGWQVLESGLGWWGYSCMTAVRRLGSVEDPWSPLGGLSQQPTVQGRAKEMSPVWKFPPQCCQATWPAHAPPICQFRKV